MATNLAPAAADYVGVNFAPLSIRTAAVPSLTRYDDAFMLLGDVEDVVFAKANTYLAAKTRLTAAQRESYASLRTAWHNTQVDVYTFTRRFFTRAFPSDLANVYAASLPYPGWLPKLTDAVELPVTPDMRSADGKRMGIANKGAELLATLAAQYPQMSFAMAVDEENVVPALGGVLATKLFAAALSAPGTSAASDHTVAAVAQRVAAATQPKSDMWKYALVGGVALIGFYWFVLRKPAAPRRGTAGLAAATRLQTLHDKVPSRYGLEVE